MTTKVRNRFGLALFGAATVAGLFFGFNNHYSRVPAFVNQVHLEPKARAGEALGTVFEIEAEGLVCAAGYVNSVQTRVYANQNHLEFWCRETDEFMDLEFESIGKGYPSQTTSSIMNHHGKLFDVVSERLWDDQGWVSLDKRGQIGGGRVISLQTRNSNDYWFVIGARDCQGVSLFSNSGYHGTYAGEGWQAWSAIYTDGDITIANIGNKMLSGDVPIATAFTSCKELALSVFDERSIWTYVIFPHRNRVIYGGPSEKGQCASLAIFDGKEVVPLKPFDCEGEKISEYYSVTPFRDRLLFGNYPIGTLFAGSVTSFQPRETIIAPPRSYDVVVPYLDYPIYRESQSIVSSYGSVFVGMYPWGEFIAYDGLSQEESVVRLFGDPERVGNPDFAPYVSAMASHVREMSTKLLGKDYYPFETMTPKSFAAMRENAIVVQNWAQRIPTIAVLNGRVCASTGSYGGYAYDPAKHPLSAEQATRYGEIHCAKLDNHVMVQEPAIHGEIQFVVTDQEMLIVKDGVTLASSKHSLSETSLSALGTPSRVVLGDGIYGSFLGNIKPIFEKN